MTTISANAPMGEVCPDAPFKSQYTLYVKSVEKCREKNETKRWSTERWLKTMTEQENFEFKDFITISYRHPRKDIIDQYFDNAHIKRVILDFFYPNKKPINRIRLWFFAERQEMFFRQGKNPHLELVKGGDLHTHIMMEGIDPQKWITSRNRKITINKSSLNELFKGEYSIEELMKESLINHLKRNIWRVGTSHQSINFKDLKDHKKRIHYTNKSLSSFEFDKWEHIDFENSDLNICPIKKPKIYLNSNR